MTNSPALQAKSITTATHRGEVWTGPELEFLKGTLDMPAIEVAEALGRTLAAVYVARSLGLEADRPAIATRKAYKAATTPVVACGACWLVHAGDCDE